ncbi:MULTISPECIES: TonB family protein [Paraburkholderia]|uniref:TonB family protein n=1 Tax=Paraburkholderia TaxID=1822464 RepID=UPI00178BD322|nr:TonB family protein [Paraburkholderia graminis]MDR6475164.1 TonB family protein [Paraburkholderia graminis]
MKTGFAICMLTCLALVGCANGPRAGQSLQRDSEGRTPDALLTGIRRQDREFAVQVQSRVRPHLRPSRSDTPSHASAVVEVRLADDGQITSATLAQSSGYVEWDTIAVAAVRQASPLPPPQIDRQRHFIITVKPAG